MYRTFQEYARRSERSTSELIREAMELYRTERIEPKKSITQLQPLNLGKVLEPVTGRTDYLEEMLDEDRD